MAIFTEEELTLFDDYLNGTMPEEEKLDFKQKLSVQEINNQFKLYLTIVNRIKSDAEIKATLKARFKKIDSKQRRKPWFLWGIAASLTGIIFIAFLIGVSKSQLKNNIAQFVILEPGIPITMSNEDSGTWPSIMQLYKQQEYSKAFIAIERKPVSDTSLYFSGIFKELDNKKNEAIKIYQQLNIANINSIFNDKATYRLAILLWEKEDYKTAKSLLNNISNNDLHIYHLQAQKALKELSKMQ